MLAQVQRRERFSDLTHHQQDDERDGIYDVISMNAEAFEVDLFEQR